MKSNLQNRNALNIFSESIEFEFIVLHDEQSHITEGNLREGCAKKAGFFIVENGVFQ